MFKTKKSRVALGAIVLVAAGYGIQRALTKRVVYVDGQPLSGMPDGATRF